MRKSDIKKLIRECINEVLNEGMELHYAFLSVLKKLLNNKNLNLEFLKSISSYKTLPTSIKITDIIKDIQEINDFDKLEEKLKSLEFYKKSDKHSQYVDQFLKLVKNENEIKPKKYNLD